ncbi:ABC transporter permease [Marinimicrobium agarilyticum]|uniref:ABC transporter permease n=1 Tax=Marinimicrobium agarilyticum TaxID=306546 RepID=UPI00041837E2|nr:ABC transporter permease [Marinimicrobium agarilyticum]
MKAFWIIVLKEIRDNLRDRRSMFFTLMYGPLLLPALMIGPLVFNVNKHTVNFEQPLSVTVAGSERAPNLMRFLSQHNIDVVEADENFLSPLREGRQKLVLEVRTSYGDAFRSGEPAPLVLHYNSSEDGADRERRRLRGVLDRYDEQMGRLRFLARGMDPQVFQPLQISEHDLSREMGGEVMVGLMIPFLLLFSMMMGGFYLAVDSTAGERERLSLEPLLVLPVSRVHLVLGKFTAVLSFVLISLLAPLLTAFFLFNLLDDSGFTSQYDFSAMTFVTAGVLHLPVAFFLTAFLVMIAAFARSTKEAQTQLGLAMMVPMIPFFVLQFMDVPKDSLTTATPLLGQYQLMGSIVQGQELAWSQAGLSMVSTTLVAALFLLLTIHRYRQESLLQ